MTISMVDVDVGEAETDRVTEIIESGMLADGPEVRAFEDEFATSTKVDHAVATSNGTTALHTALEALGIGQGDRVITTPFSFIASANAIRLVGAEPVFADIDPGTYNLNPAAVENHLQEDGDIAAVLAVHLYGLPADMNRLKELADRYDVHLIEDAAQAHGATVDGQPVGSIGDVGCFSFYPTKNMTTGEGGMITTDDETIAKQASSFANHGRTAGSRDYDHATVGHNFRMTSIAAAIGRVQLKRLNDFVNARQTHAAQLSRGLEDSAVEIPSIPDNRTHSFHQYTIRYENRNELREHLADQEIDSGVYYPRVIPDEGAYRDSTVDVPTARTVASEVLSLPVHPGLDNDDLDHIVEVIQKYATR